MPIRNADMIGTASSAFPVSHPSHASSSFVTGSKYQQGLHPANLQLFERTEMTAPRAVEVSNSYIQKLSPQNSHPGGPNQRNELVPAPLHAARMGAATTSPAFPRSPPTTQFQSPSLAYAKAFRDKVLLNLKHQQGNSQVSPVFPPNEAGSPSNPSLLLPLNMKKYQDPLSVPSSNAHNVQPAPAPSVSGASAESNSKQNKIHAYAAVQRPLQPISQPAHVDPATESSFRDLSPRLPFANMQPLHSTSHGNGSDEIAKHGHQRILSHQNQQQRAGNNPGITPLIASRTQQLQLAVLESAATHERAGMALPTPRPSSPVSLATHRMMQDSDPDIQTRVDDDIVWLNQATVEYNAMRGQIESKLRSTQTQKENPAELEDDSSMNDEMMKLKQDLMCISDLVTSKDSTDQVDGLLLLGVFLDENKELINCDGLMMLFMDVLRFIPSLDNFENQLNLSEKDFFLKIETACFCICHMCKSSQSILEHARLLDAVPRILSLIKYAVTSNTTMAKP
jgi:hypothetical protein